MTEPAWARHLPAGTAPESVDLTRRVTLPRAWVSWWRAHPDQQVIVDPGGPSVTGADLLDRTRLAAGRLAGAGLRPGDRVLVSGAGLRRPRGGPRRRAAVGAGGRAGQPGLFAT